MLGQTHSAACGLARAVKPQAAEGNPGNNSPLRPWSKLMNPGRLFAAGCLALITSAFSFMIRADIADPLSTEFNLSKVGIGEVMGAAFLGMAVAMLAIAPLCDYLGMGRVMFMAWRC